MLDIYQSAIAFIAILGLFLVNLVSGMSPSVATDYTPPVGNEVAALVGDVLCTGHGDQTSFQIRLDVDSNGNIIPGKIGADGHTVVGSAIGFHVQQNLVQSNDKFSYDWRRIVNGSFERNESTGPGKSSQYVLFFQHVNVIQDGVFLQTFIVGGDHAGFMNGINSNIPWPKAILDYLAMFPGERVRVNNCGVL